MKIRPIVLILLSAMLVLQIAACGQKGPLRIPNPAGSAAETATPTVATSLSRTVAP